jgi:hypothetical protein
VLTVAIDSPSCALMVSVCEIGDGFLVLGSYETLCEKKTRWLSRLVMWALYYASYLGFLLVLRLVPRWKASLYLETTDRKGR